MSGNIQGSWLFFLHRKQNKNTKSNGYPAKDLWESNRYRHKTKCLFLKNKEVRICFCSVFVFDCNITEPILTVLIINLFSWTWQFPMELNENITHCNEEKLIFQGKKTKNKNAIYFCLKNQRKTLTLSFEEGKSIRQSVV